MPPVTQNQPRQTQAPLPGVRQTAQEKPAEAPSDFDRLLAKDHRMEYVPFGSQDKIRLSVSIVRNLIAVPTKTNKLPDDNECLKFMAMCQSKRLNPFEGDCYLLGYDTNSGPKFSLITAHQAYLKRAEIHPEFDGMKSGLIVHEDNEDGTYSVKEIEGDFYEPDQKVVGGWAEVYFKNRKVAMKKRLRLERFKKPFGVWMDDAAGMICKCAEADALRSSFPTMLGGLYLREEIEFEPALVTPDFKPADLMKGGNPALFSQTNGVAPVPTPTPTPAAEAPKPESAKPEPETPLGNLRKALAAKGLTENMLLNHLLDVGSVSDGIASLDELALANPEIIGIALENIDSIAAACGK